MKMNNLMMMGALLLASTSVMFGQVAKPLAGALEVTPESKKISDLMQAGKLPEAFEVADQLARAGNADGLYYVGFAYEVGMSVVPNRDKMLEYYQKAVEKNQPAAITRLSFVWLSSEKDSDHELARLMLEKAVLSVPAVAGRILGDAWLQGRFGKDVVKNFDNCMIWWGKAADAGNVACRVMMGKGYEGAFGFPERVNMSKSSESYTKAASAGNVESMLIMAARVLADPEDEQKEKEGLAWADMAIDKGANFGYFVKGNYYLHVKKDVAKAMEFFVKGGGLGERSCNLALGKYEEETKKDVVKAADYYEKALRAGEGKAGYALYVLNGKATDEATRGKAYNYLVKGGTLGDTKAALKLGEKYLAGDFGAKDTTAAFAWLNRAVQGGDTDAAMILGRMYEEGAEVPRNLASAREYYGMAANGFNVEGLYRFAMITLNSGGDPKVIYPSVYASFTVAAELGNKESGVKLKEIEGKMSAEMLSEGKSNLLALRGMMKKALSEKAAKEKSGALQIRNDQLPVQSAPQK